MEENIKLTKLASCGGCGAKVGAGVLAQLLEGLQVHYDPNLLVGFDKSDDVFGSYLLENADFDVSAKKSFYKIRLRFNCETAPKDKITLTLTDEYSRKCIREFMIFSAGEKYKDIYFNFRCRNLTVGLTLPNDVRFLGGEIFYTI